VEIRRLDVLLTRAVAALFLSASADELSPFRVFEKWGVIFSALNSS
jgi:hypothetical protein